MQLTDIVVRNLYERTADIGFLATDRELCEFVAGIQTDADKIRMRLRDYRSKYTVYEEILLLDTKGNVLVQTDEEAPVRIGYRYAQRMPRQRRKRGDSLPGGLRQVSAIFDKIPAAYRRGFREVAPQRHKSCQPAIPMPG